MITYQPIHASELMISYELMIISEPMNTYQCILTFEHVITNMKGKRNEKMYI
jgi:hypothetical protein